MIFKNLFFSFLTFFLGVIRFHKKKHILAKCGLIKSGEMGGTLEDRARFEIKTTSKLWKSSHQQTG